jgi:hypothetical protein
MIMTIGCYLWPFLVSLLFSNASIESSAQYELAEAAVIPAASTNTAQSGMRAALFPVGQSLIIGSGEETLFDLTMSGFEEVEEQGDLSQFFSPAMFLQDAQALIYGCYDERDSENAQAPVSESETR